MFSFFFFNDTATTEIYTLSLHDALPISIARVHLEELEVLEHAPVRGEARHVDVECRLGRRGGADHGAAFGPEQPLGFTLQDRKSTRLNSSHGYISYAVFCLKKKKDQHPAKHGAPPSETRRHACRLISSSQLQRPRRALTRQRAAPNRHS